MIYDKNTNIVQYCLKKIDLIMMSLDYWWETKIY